MRLPACLVLAALLGGCGTARVSGHGLSVAPPRGWHVRIAQPPHTALSLTAATVRAGANGIFDQAAQRSLGAHDVMLVLLVYTAPRGHEAQWRRSFPVRRLVLRRSDVGSFEGQVAAGGANASFRWRSRYVQLIAFFGERPTADDLARANGFLARVRASPR